MPMEDATVTWDERLSPFVHVGRLHIPAQQFESKGQQRYCEDLSFTPWHALPEHRPLGSLNRLRKPVYESVSKLRHAHNHAPRREPTDLTLPAAYQQDQTPWPPLDDNKPSTAAPPPAAPNGSPSTDAPSTDAPSTDPAGATP